MAAKKRGLGRGLDALLGSSAASVIANPTLSEEQNNEGLQMLPVDVIQRGRFQPRQNFAADALQELADSINAQGVVER